MKHLGSYVIVGTLALAAACAMVQSDAGMAEVHVASAAAGGGMLSVDWLLPAGR